MTRLTRDLPVVLVCAALCSLGISPAAAQDGGMLRLAHLSPDTPAVDVYVDSVSQPGDPVVLPAVGYGAVSDYRDVEPGAYTVSMRATGEPADSPPVLSTTLDVQAGSAHTVAGLGAFADLGLEILADDLSLPDEDCARVRVISAASAAPMVDVTVGNTIAATGLEFGQASDYVLVPEGATSIEVTPTNGTPMTLPADIDIGSVYTVLVLDGAGGQLQVQPTLDAAAMGVVPVGGVETGAGGTAATSPDAWTTPAALGVAAVALAGLLLSFRGRRSLRGSAARPAARR